MSTGMTALASKFGSTARRQNMPSPMTDNTVAMVSKIVLRGNTAVALGSIEQLDEAVVAELVDGAEQFANRLVAGQFETDLDAQQPFVLRFLDRVMLAELGKGGQQVGRLRQRGQLAGELGAITLDDACDQVFL